MYFFESKSLAESNVILAKRDMAFSERDSFVIECLPGKDVYTIAMYSDNNKFCGYY